MLAACLRQYYICCALDSSVLGYEAPSPVHAHVQDAQAIEAARPKAAPEPPAEEKQAPTPPQAAEVHKEEGAGEARMASSAPGPGKSEAEKDEEEDAGGSPTSISSWHGTPTWNDITTFSQVRHLTFNPCSDATFPV